MQVIPIWDYVNTDWRQVETHKVYTWQPIEDNKMIAGHVGTYDMALSAEKQITQY